MLLINSDFSKLSYHQTIPCLINWSTLHRLSPFTHTCTSPSPGTSLSLPDHNIPPHTINRLPLSPSHPPSKTLSSIGPPTPTGPASWRGAERPSQCHPPTRTQGYELTFPPPQAHAWQLQRHESLLLFLHVISPLHLYVTPLQLHNYTHF